MHLARILLVTLVSSLVLASCATVSEQDMEVQAAQQFSEMKASLPLETDRATIDYIACVANAVVAQLEPPYSEINWEMAVFDNESVNAFAMPGGKIGVMTGILKAAQNQDQLAAVIGHEIAHVTAQHAKERASRTSVSDIGIQAAAIVLGGGHSGATYTAYEALRQGAAFGLLLPFSRGQETEADVIGLSYMAKAGFDPRESVPLWQNMAKEAGTGPAEFLSTHPSSDTRIDNLVSQFGGTLKLYNDALTAGLRPNCTL